MRPLRLAVVVVVIRAGALGAQTPPPPLTACQLVRLRSVDRWELDYTYRLTNDLDAQGSSGSVGTYFPLKDWTYAHHEERYFRLQLQVAGQSGPSDCERFGPNPCVAQYPSTLTVLADGFTEATEAQACPGVHAAGCGDAERCFRGECGGGPCDYSARRDTVVPAPSVTFDGSPGQQLDGEMTIDYDVNPPVVEAYFDARSTGQRRFTQSDCVYPPQDVTSDRTFSGFTDFRPFATVDHDAIVRLVDGRFVVQDEVGFERTDMAEPISDGGSFPRTVAGSASWTLHEARDPTVLLVGMEVNQAVQDWRQRVPLIRDKPTVVRAHIQPVSIGSGPPLPVAGRLHGFRGGQELPGSPLPADTALISEAARNVRGGTVSTLDWVLPPAWLDGDVELCVESGAPLRCIEPAEAGGTAGDCGVRVGFGDAPPLRVKLVAVRWGLFGTHVAAPADLDELEGRLAAILPTAQLTATRGELRVFSVGKPDLRRVNRLLDAMRLADCEAGGPCDSTYYGVLQSDDGTGFPVGGTSAYGLANDVPGTVSSGLYLPDAGHYARNVHAHEIAHVLGRPHAVDPEEFGMDGTSPQGPCGAVADAGAEVFPFFHVVGSGFVPTLGPLLSGEDEKIYGFDTHWHRVIDPYRTFELMGYCVGTSATTGRSKWISSHTYAQLKSFLASSWFGGTPVPPPGGAATDVLLASGTVDRDTDTAELSPVVVLPAARAPEPPSGDEYALELRDAGGGTLASVPVAPLYAEPDAPGARIVPSVGTFVVAAPAPAGLAEVTLLRAGAPKATLRASANAPTVTVLVPNGGETLGPGEEAFVWDAADADGDPLAFFVQWSPDGGATWQTLVSEWPEPTLPVDAGILARTETGRLRVVASDGLRTGMDESDADVAVAGKPPRVAILPPTGTRPIVGDDAAVFRGTARDPDGGTLVETAFVWRSDLSGTLGTGPVLALPGSALVPGTHAITLEVRDVEGLSGTATASLLVVREGPVCGDGGVDPGEVCDDGNLLDDDECSADCLTATAGSTTTTVQGGTSTTTNTVPTCGPECVSHDPCTEKACVDGACVSTPRAGLAGVSCLCEQTPPAACGGQAPPRPLARAVTRACAALSRLEAAGTPKAAKRRERNASTRLRKAAAVATRLGKHRLGRECGEAWRARLLAGAEALALLP